MPTPPQEPQQAHLHPRPDPSSLEQVESRSTSDPNEPSSCAQPLTSRYCIEACIESLSWRGWLVYLACLLVLIIIIGIVCSAHVYYHDMGGQGWLKLKQRSQEQFEGVQSTSQVCLPMRPLGPYNTVFGLSPRKAAPVPWYTCGDQQNSCEAYAHPVSFSTIFEFSPRLIISPACYRRFAVLKVWFVDLQLTPHQAYTAAMERYHTLIVVSWGRTQGAGLTTLNARKMWEEVAVLIRRLVIRINVFRYWNNHLPFARPMDQQ